MHTPEELAECIRHAQDVVRDGDSVESVLHALRAHGLSKIETMVVLVKGKICPSLREAKIVVHDSPTWADRREADEEFHARLPDALDDLKNE